jgi:hypothetical protein
VVAEGVERPAQLVFLSQCGPITVQGFLLAQAVEMTAVPKEAAAAAARALAVLEEHASSLRPGESPGHGPLVFVGANPRRNTR